MKLKNISARPHWIGDVLIAPGGVGVIDKAWVGAYNKDDLVPVVDAELEQPAEESAEMVAPKKRGPKPKVKIDDAA